MIAVEFYIHHINTFSVVAKDLPQVKGVFMRKIPQFAVV